MPPTTLEPNEAALRHLADAHEGLADLIRRHGPYRMGRPNTRDHFEGLVQAIVSQQLSSKAADTIYGRVKAIAVDDEGALSAARLLALSEESLRGAGLSGAKLRSIWDLSTRVHEGKLAIEAFGARSDDEVIRELCAVKGIGRWTAEMYLMFCLGRPDVLPLGDLGIRKGMMRLFRLRKLPEPERMVKLARPFRPFRSIACWYLWRLTEEKPTTAAK